MQVLLLPGYSTKNERERDSIAAALRGDGHNVLAHGWRHWEDDSAQFSLEAELARIDELIGSQQTTEAFAAVGKSVGNFVAAVLLQNKPSVAARTRRLLLMGVPLAGAGEEEREQLYQALSELDIPVTVVQNTEDKYGSADTVRAFLKGLPVELIVREAKNHRYDYPDLVREIIGRA
jgi:predicted alpha/beta-hydrolase family hydrolase